MERSVQRVRYVARRTELAIARGNDLLGRREHWQ